MTEQNPKNKSKDNDVDYGYTTAIAGLIAAAVLIIVMFATSGQV